MNNKVETILKKLSSWKLILSFLAGFVLMLAGLILAGAMHWNYNLDTNLGMILDITFIALFYLFLVTSWIKLYLFAKSKRDGKTLVYVLLVITCVLLASLILFSMFFFILGAFETVLIDIAFLAVLAHMLSKSGNGLRVTFAILFVGFAIYVYKTIDLPGPMMWAIQDRPIDYPGRWLDCYPLYRWTTIFTAILHYSTTVYAVIWCILKLSHRNRNTTV